MTREAAIAYLARKCRRWGGELRIVKSLDDLDEDAITSYHPNDDHAIHHGDLIVYAERATVNPGVIIHEMGHVFLDEPWVHASDEWAWLGWEIALAREARCYTIWDAQNDGYGLGDDYNGKLEWSDLKRDEKRDVARERLRVARQYGYLDRDFRPIRAREMGS